ncbi:phytanoyl-CoA dioxygenase family protein [Candidatus Pelagibacter sp.]|jgi:ectoine hydroxylase-related dioxygenase (phytanoyl-CoA dioxygenase family)|nr:phytanoyl-CoA dioxygenase family protein [Candidatus Pelagibacter sp.]
MKKSNETILKSFNNNSHKYRNSFQKKGYLVVRNVLNKRDFLNIERLIYSAASKYINFKKKKINGLNDLKFNEELINLRKKNKKKFSAFFDTLQTSIATYQFWTHNKILHIVKKILQCNLESISVTDLLIRLDSPIDKRNKLEWHQDSAYFRQNNDGANGLNCWTPLTDLIMKMGPLEFLENSHKIGRIKVKKVSSGKFKSIQRKIPENLIKNFKIKKFELKLGDFIFLNMNTVHRSGENISKVFRTSTICRYHKTNTKDFNPGLNVYKYSDKTLNKEVHGF